MMSSYLQNLRTLIGKRKVIHPAARIIIENEEGDILMIRRTDNGKWGLPAGSLEEDEDIEACIRREVREETGLELLHLEVIGISSRPERESVQYPNGDQVQYFVVEFYSNSWEGQFYPGDEEVSDIRFGSIDDMDRLPDQEWATFESLIYYRATGQIRLR
jgi:8-oxo-dGTP pyrophosphatase MutT (NUDIX family)